MRHVAWSLMVLAMMLTGASHAEAQGQSIYVDYYTPQFYMDHLVFYDEVGTPIFYQNDVPYAVPEDYPFYNELLDHFYRDVDAYLRWFGEVGYANLHYRRPPAASYYTPIYYLEYPVFFDDRGQPYIYVNGEVHWVPRSYGRYQALLRHYRAKRAQYARWLRERGRYYRWYRRSIATSYYQPVYYDGYVVFFDRAGNPYYYRNNRRVQIASSEREHARFVRHYRTHRTKYDRWYRDKGRQHHGYRRPRTTTPSYVKVRAPKASNGRAVVRTYTVRPDRSRRRPAGRVEERRDDRAGRPVGDPKRPVRAGRPDAPRRNDRADRPVGDPKRPVRAGRPDAPRRNDRADRPVGDPKRPVRAGRPDAPRRNDRADRPAGDPKRPVRAGRPDAPTRNDRAGRPAGNPKRPVQSGRSAPSQRNPREARPTGEPKRPVKSGSQGKQGPDCSRQPTHPLCRGRGDNKVKPKDRRPAPPAR